MRHLCHKKALAIDARSSWIHIDEGCLKAFLSTSRLDGGTRVSIDLTALAIGENPGTRLTQAGWRFFPTFTPATLWCGRLTFKQ